MSVGDCSHMSPETASLRLRFLHVSVRFCKGTLAKPSPDAFAIQQGQSLTEMLQLPPYSWLASDVAFGRPGASRRTAFFNLREKHRMHSPVQGAKGLLMKR